MSNDDKDEQSLSPEDDSTRTDATVSSETEAESVPEPEAEPEPQPDAEPEPEAAAAAAASPEQLPPREKGSGGIAWLALFFSLAAFAALGYLLVQDWREQQAKEQSASSLADLRTRLASSNESLSNLDRGLAELAEADVRAASELEALQRGVENRIELLDSLPSRMTNVERSLATLQGVSAGARDTFLLAEAEYYMQIANAQLQLAGNPHLAALALEMADERIVQLANPALTDVRRVLADELAALEVMEKPDIEGVTLTLASLARVVAALPILQVTATDSAENGETDTEQSGMGRAWASVKGAVAGLVKVSRPEETAIPLLTPEAEYFLRTNLTLQLQAARLALLRGEQAVFQQSLDDATNWMSTYFDTESAQVDGALQTIAEIRDSMFTAAAPDISESLRLLRQFKTLEEPAE